MKRFKRYWSTNVTVDEFGMVKGDDSQNLLGNVLLT